MLWRRVAVEACGGRRQRLVDGGGGGGFGERRLGYIVPSLYPLCTPLYPHCTPTVPSLYPHCTLPVPRSMRGIGEKGGGKRWRRRLGERVTTRIETQSSESMNAKQSAVKCSTATILQINKRPGPLLVYLNQIQWSMVNEPF